MEELFMQTILGSLMVNSKMEQSMAILDGLINLVAASKRNIKMVIIKENFEICVHISYDDKKNIFNF